MPSLFIPVLYMLNSTVGDRLSIAVCYSRVPECPVNITLRKEDSAEEEKGLFRLENSCEISTGSTPTA